MSVQSLRSDETGRRTEPVLATPVGRPTWLLANLAVTAGGAVLIAAVSGAATGLGAAVATGDAAHLGALVLAQLNQVPAALVVLAVAAALLSVLPSAVPAAWALVGYALVVQTFGPMLDLPSGAGNLSPFEHVAAMPLESFDAAPVLVLVALAAGLVALGVLGFRRRDVATV